MALGKRIFHGEVGGATCAGCHGSDAIGTPVGPDLASGKWLWGDGSLESITQTIANGVPERKVPPMGGLYGRQPGEMAQVADRLTSHFRLFHVAYDGLPTVIDVDVLDANVLLPTVTKPSKHFDLGRIGSQ